MDRASESIIGSAGDADAAPVAGGMPAVSLAELVSRIAPGSKVGVPSDYGGVAIAATFELIAQSTGNLHVVCVPTSGMQVDLLIGAGLVGTLETSAVSLGEAGTAPRFTVAVRQGSLRLIDATCPAILTGLLAAQKGVPFIPMRGLIGTDVLARRPDWKQIDNPYQPGDPIVLIPAIQLDTALFHATMADRDGNVWIGRRRELASLAYAARQTLVTVEQISETSLLADEKLSAGVLPALYVSGVAQVSRGSYPYGVWGSIAADPQGLADYAAAAASDDGFARYLARDRAPI